MERHAAKLAVTPEPRRPGVRCSAASRGVVRRTGFTIVELLVSVAIIVVLLAVLLPALGMGITTARGFRCQMNLRSIAFDFAVFADEGLHGNRGDDAGSPNFSLETFVESQYGVSEFWSWGPGDMAERVAEGDVMRCSEVRGPLTMRRNVSCQDGALSPTKNVSYTFNMRLWKAEFETNGVPRVRPVRLTGAILQQSRVPLVWDIDAEAAALAGTPPHFSAPSMDSTGPFAGDAFWHPSTRHGSRGNYALLDGSVHASGDALNERWNWSYQPLPRR